jgi:hypothetical protein
MDKYSEILSSFGTQETLNPEIWDDVESGEPKLKPQIRKALLMIAGEFMDYLGDDLFVDDVRFTGSLANFNWSKFSDIDLHLYVDFTQFDPEDVEMYKELFTLKKTLFNTTHNITVKGFDVELYAEDIDESHFSSGVYSVMFDTWVHNPEKENVKIDKEMLLSKTNSMMSQIDSIIEDAEGEDYDKSVKRLDTFKDRLKKFRSSGLEKDGEFSYENLVFKFLRRNGYIQKLFDFKNKLIDKNLSVENTDVE